MKAYGIDFGTTNSLVSLWDNEGVRVLPMEKNSQNIIRSVMYYHPDKGFEVGKRAIELYLDDVAKGEPLRLVEKFTGKYVRIPKPLTMGGFAGMVDVPQVILVEEGNRGRLLQGLKSVLTARFEGTELFGNKYSLEDLLTVMMTEIKKRADEMTGEEVDSVVLGRPVKYVGANNEELALKRMREVARRAGFRNVEFEMEPVGAALSYGVGRQEREKVAIFDFGGGTLDVSVMDFPSGRVLGVSGAPIGGDLIDSKIFEQKLMKYFGGEVRFGKQGLPIPTYIAGSLKNWYSISLLKTKAFLDSVESLMAEADDKNAIQALKDLVVYNLGFMLHEEIDRVKISLSSVEAENLVFDQKSIHINEHITRGEFEDLVSDLLQLVDQCVNAGLKNAGVKPQQIDRLVITGGSSLIPAVRNHLALKFGAEKIISEDVFESVVKGLGIKAGQIYG